MGTINIVSAILALMSGIGIFLTPSVGAHYLSLSSNAERIADHLINIAKSIRSTYIFN
jgi:phosphate uptake regulator